MTPKLFAIIAALVFVGLVAVFVGVEVWKSRQGLSMEEICLQIDQLPHGNEQEFREWMGSQYVHVMNPIDVATCLFMRLS